MSSSTDPIADFLTRIRNAIQAAHETVEIPASKLKLVFNQVEDDSDVNADFDVVLAFVQQTTLMQPSTRCRLGANEIYERIKGSGTDIAALVRDDTDYKALIARAGSTAEKVALAQKLANRRLASGVVPEFDACFAALELEESAVAP